VRLLLDAHASGRAIGRQLREAGHDVLAICDDRQFDALPDEDVLDLAARERRVLVTFNIKDFAVILRDWADEGGEHAGCILMAGMDHREFGAVLRSLEVVFAQRADQTAWANVSLVVSRTGG
jgi:nucleoside-diphosphate-sugar epimerase